MLSNVLDAIFKHGISVQHASLLAVAFLSAQCDATDFMRKEKKEHLSPAVSM